MKKKLIAVLIALFLLLSVGITVKSAFSFNPDAYLKEVAEKVSQARGVDVNLEAKLTGDKSSALSYYASGKIVFPRKFRIEGRATTPFGSLEIGEIDTENFVYLKLPTTDGKWVTVSKREKNEFTEQKQAVQNVTLEDLVNSVERVESSELDRQTRTLKAVVDPQKFVAVLKDAGAYDWYSERFPRIDSVRLVLKVDEATGYVVRSELSVKEAGGPKSLQVNVDYSNWDSKTDVTDPPRSQTLSEEEGTRLLKARRHFDRGMTAYKAGDASGAVDEFAMAVDYQPGNYAYNVWLAKAQLKKRNYADAELYAQKAMKIGQSKADAYIVASQIAALDDQWKPERRTQAITYAQQAVKLNPNSSEAYTALGLAYWAKTLPSFADPAAKPVDYETQVREETPTAPPGFFKNRAIVAFDKASELDPNAPEPLFLKGLLLVSQRDILDTLLSSNFKPEALAKAADDFERAAGIFEEVSKIDPNFVEEKLKPQEKGYAELSKEVDLAKKIGRLVDLSAKLRYDAARWKELKGKAAGDAYEDWYNAVKECFEAIYGMVDVKPTQGYYDAMKALENALNMAKPLL